jgi:hypothetical protein
LLAQAPFPKETTMTDETVTAIDACLRERLPAALEVALQAVLPELAERIIEEAPAALSCDARSVERSLHAAIDLAKLLDVEIDELASQAYDIERSLKNALSFASYLDDEVGSGRSHRP